VGEAVMESKEGKEEMTEGDPAGETTEDSRGD